MIRSALHVLLAVFVCFLVVNTSVVGQDKVERRDRKTDKSVIVNGKIIEESMAGVKMKIGGAKEEMIPGIDVQRIFYDDIPQTLKLSYNNLFINEEKEKDQSKVLKDYRDFATKVATTPGVNASAKRYIEYRITMLQTGLAEADDAKREAVRLLEAFVAAHGTSWEYPYAARALARMQLEKSDYEAALKTLNGLARGAAVPADIKQEAEAMLVDVLFQAKKIDDVKTKIDLAMKDPKTSDQQKARYTVYSIAMESQGADAKVDAVVKKLDDVIAKTADNSLKALAYNIMGDCYMQKEKKREAMWSYLWVDVVYSQDKGEHLKAMNKLLKIFEEDKDLEKVQLYKDKIVRLK